MIQLDNVVKFEDQDLMWNFDGKCYFQGLKRGGEYDWRMTEYVDPTPCFSYDINEVKKYLDKYNNIVKLPFKNITYILPREGLHRTNGQASESDISDKKMETEIVLFGRRVNTLGLLTEYIVGHELSHCTEYQLLKILKNSDEKSSEEKFERVYAELRGVEYDNRYGPKYWGSNIGEIIANDCRILVYNSRPDFWNHDVTNPLDKTVYPKLKDFWNKQVEIINNYIL